MEKLLTPQQVSDATGLTVRALAQMRYLGRGIPYRQLSPRTIRYAESDVAAYVASVRRTGTREGAA